MENYDSADWTAAESRLVGGERYEVSFCNNLEKYVNNHYKLLTTRSMVASYCRR
jgi:hypothetical protein